MSGEGNILQFKIDGKPIAKQSMKFTRGGHKYTPAHIVEYSNYVKMCFKMAYPNHTPQVFENTPLDVNIKVTFQIPSTFSKKKHSQATCGTLRPLVKPDLDNISKNILDSLNGLAYHDDKQIVSLNVEKFYGDEPNVIVSIMEVNNG